jgi:hypothetical protein
VTPAIVIVVIVFLGLAAGIALVASRRPAVAPPPPPEIIEDDDAEARRARQALAAERGTELLERRIALDARRGTLGGDTQLYDALEDLQERLRSGQISEDEYEQEKVRLLGG